MLACIRRLQQGTVVVGTLVLLVLLSIASPANAVSSYSYYGTYTPIQKCEEVGRDLVYSRTATSWICNRNRNNKKFFDLKVRYRNQPH